MDKTLGMWTEWGLDDRPSVGSYVGMSRLCLFVALALGIPAYTFAEPLRSADGRLEVSLPTGWAATVLEGPGQIHATSTAKNAFAIVVSEPKEDFAFKRIDEYAARILRLEKEKAQLEDRVV
jgi:hypothetical protein